MKSIIIPIILIFTIASTNGGLLPGSHFTPNLVTTRTILGGAVGGAPSSGAFSAAHYSQTVAAPGTIHTIVSTQPVNHYGFSGTPSNGNTNIGSSGSNGGGTGYGTYGYIGVNAGQGVSSGGQQHQGYSQPNNHQQPHNYY